MKRTEIVTKLIAGTAAFYLGKKATEYASHRWTLYVRGAQGEDLTHFVSKVVFRLHESFQSPIRELTVPPYELTEVGWGEFDIAVTVHFSDDCMAPPLELVHKLKLYAEHDPTGQASTKKPVVSESYEEIVFSEPTELFYNRYQEHIPMQGPPVSVAQFLSPPDATADMQKITAARQRVAASRTKFMQQLEAAG